VFKRLLLIFNGLILGYYCFGQNKTSPVVLASGGGFFSANGYSLSYTYGELSVKTLSKNNYILTEGFQQGKFQAGLSSPINDIKYGPNPVDQTLKIYFYFQENQSFSIQVFSLLGQLSGTFIQKDIVNGMFVNIEFGGLGKGLYLVKIQSLDGKFMRILKIEKI
jgi:hypothetical protein